MAKDATWLDEEVEPCVKGLVSRPAHASEILAVFGGSMQHIAGVVDGRFVGLVSLRHIDGRLWAMLTVTAAPEDAWSRMAIVSALRKELRNLTEPIWVVQDDAYPQAGTLLQLVGLAPTGEMMGTRRVWSSERTKT